MAFDAKQQVKDFAEACVRCGLCAKTDCGNFAPGTPCLGEICDSLLSGDETWRHFPFTCALCNRCTLHCPVGLVAHDANHPLRNMLLDTYPEIRGLYRKFRTDLKYNLFSMLQGRNAGDISEFEVFEEGPHISAEADRTAFFPGCALSSYASELTAAVASWLREEGIASHVSYACCGATFYGPGFAGEFEVYAQQLVEHLHERGVERLVMVCPHCTHVFETLMTDSGLELLLLPELLLERGKTSELAETLSFHDSCYDRDEGRFAELARNLFPNMTEQPMAHNRKECLCCGGGGLVSCYAPDYCTYRRNQRLVEIDEAGADRVLSTCYSCVNSLQRGVGATPVQHYLEPLFGIETDWGTVYAQVEGLYADPDFERLSAEDTPMFSS